jgi:hypothetical protein
MAAESRNKSKPTAAASAAPVLLVCGEDDFNVK